MNYVGRFIKVNNNDQVLSHHGDLLVSISLCNVILSLGLTGCPIHISCLTQVSMTSPHLFNTTVLFGALNQTVSS
jgi:hypothetical protein